MEKITFKWKYHYKGGEYEKLSIGLIDKFKS